MTPLRLVWRSLRFYWRSHLGTVAGTAVAATVLVGALLVGDSVKATLGQLAHLRIGLSDIALSSGDRFFRDALAGELRAQLRAGPLTVAPVLRREGSMTTPDRSRRVNAVQILGVDERFWQLAPGDAAEHAEHLRPGINGIALNERLAAQLDVTTGDIVILRMEKPAFFSRDAPLSGSENAVVATGMRVSAVVSDRGYGRFALRAGQVPPSNGFVAIENLQGTLSMRGQANLLLVGGGGEQVSVVEAARALRDSWKLEDLSLEVGAPSGWDGWELRTRRVFLDREITRIATQTPSRSSGRKVLSGVLSYFVNSLTSGDRATPYSIVTAVDPWTGGFLPLDMAADEIVINRWLADDLGARVGDSVEISYYVLSERRALVERTAGFRIRKILPLDGQAGDAAWMPQFPGLVDAQNCREWDPGIPIDLDRIREKDEDYWDRFRGTPKAFLTLETGQRLWSNPWGDLTAIRYPAPDYSAGDIRDEIEKNLDPARIGMYFLPLRDEADAGTESPVDFGQLFSGFSFFLLTAAAIITGLFFVFTVEQRNSETGLLLALGISRHSALSWIFFEGVLLALTGAATGTAAAVGYTHLVLGALATVWSDAAGTTTFAFDMRFASLATGMAASVVIALLAMAAASRRQVSYSAAELLASGDPSGFDHRRSGNSRQRWKIWLGTAAIGGAFGLLAFATDENRTQVHAARVFFASGALLLGAAGVFFSHWLVGAKLMPGNLPSLSHLGRRNVGRRPGRSLATAMLLASGVYMVIAVSAFRLRELPGHHDRASGTGGFALIGESTLPVYGDLNTAAGRKTYTLAENVMRDIGIVPMRQRSGDDASCLNLNRAMNPRLLAVRSDDLVKRGAFTFSDDLADSKEERGWAILERRESDGAIPAVADENTIRWALGKALGDTLTYRDDAGNVFTVRLAGAVAGSLLQGNIIIAEGQFLRRYPSSAGYRYFLIDAPADRVKEISEILTRALEDQGLQLTVAARRLAEFQAVENTYISIFQALGGLGLILGTTGLGVIIARNIAERRSEFALLGALGFRPSRIRHLLFLENRWLIVMGLVTGSAAALVAIWPTIRASAEGFSGRWLLTLLVALTGLCLSWSWLATRLALRGCGAETLRKE